MIFAWTYVVFCLSSYDTLMNTRTHTRNLLVATLREFGRDLFIFPLFWIVSGAEAGGAATSLVVFPSQRWVLSTLALDPTSSESSP